MPKNADAPTISHTLHKSPHVLGLKPAHLIECSPQLTRLVDINLARLLRRRLAKFLAVAHALEPALEDSPLAT